MFTTTPKPYGIPLSTDLYHGFRSLYPLAKSEIRLTSRVARPPPPQRPSAPQTPRCSWPGEGTPPPLAWHLLGFSHPMKPREAPWTKSPVSDRKGPGSSQRLEVPTVERAEVLQLPASQKANRRPPETQSRGGAAGLPGPIRLRVVSSTHMSPSSPPVTRCEGRSGWKRTQDTSERTDVTDLHLLFIWVLIY